MKIDAFLFSLGLIIRWQRQPVDGVPVADINTLVTGHARQLINHRHPVNHFYRTGHAVTRTDITTGATITLDTNAAGKTKVCTEPIDQPVHGTDGTQELAISPAFAGKKTQ